MRRLIWTALAVAAVALMPARLAAFDLPKTGGLPKPTAELKRFQLDSLTLREVTFLFEVSVKNPYPVPLDVSGMSLVFYVEDNKALELASKGGFSVPANGTKSNSFTATLRFEDLFRIIKDYATRDWLLTKIDGTLVIPIPKVPGMSGLPPSVSFSYELKKRIPALKPTVSVVDFKVLPPTAEQVGKALAKAGKKVDQGKALGVFKDVLAGKKPSSPVIDPREIDVPLTVSFTIELANDSKASLSFARLGYVFYLNGEQLVVGDTTQIRREGSRTFLTVQNVFSSKQLSDGVRRIFTEHKGEFRVSGKTDIKLPDEIRVEPVPLGFDESGSFQL
ncbi:MAG TPA: LEA type 2 family protein [Rectinemataceae bacterium]|nr:LEA type 2 family protein [Rectinemataceae bacterium]